METLNTSDRFSLVERLAPLTIASFFENDFSIDWIMELTGLKPTQILAELEEGVLKGNLIRTGAGYFAFSDLKEKEEISDDLDKVMAEALNAYGEEFKDTIK